VLLVVCGRYSSSLHRAYSLFFVVGTFGATHVPCILWAPFKSQEQLGPLAVFFLLQCLELYIQYSKRNGAKEASIFTPLIFTGAIAALVLAVLVPSGIFGPFSIRIQALFFEHTKTGNPLVDSVVEHQPGNADAYWQYLKEVCYIAPIGWILLLAKPQGPSNSALFGALLSGVTYFFSLKMARLIIFMGPTASVLAGVAIGAVVDEGLHPLRRALSSATENEDRSSSSKTVLGRWHNSWIAHAMRVGLLVLAVVYTKPHARKFYDDSHALARSLSHPQIMSKVGNQVIDDYRESYWWLRDHTPKDARVMAWWDYGYQIAGLANRTTIADGNTWNQEHIALLGLALTSPVDEAYPLIRNLADYILIWRDGPDDMGKSIHMARIANSIFKGHCNEPECQEWGFHGDGRATSMTDGSMMFLLDGRTGSDGKTLANDERFQEVYNSKNNKVRIVKVLGINNESKAWSADPTNRLCDAPGSWYCPGIYPPQLQDLLSPKPQSTEAVKYQHAFEHRIEAQKATLPKPNGPGLPDASYLNSCKGCSVEGNRLRCTHCTTPGSPPSTSELDILAACPRPQGINNIHGELKCQPQPNAHDIPKGGYKHSCDGCRLVEEKKVLECMVCNKANGRQETSRYELARCPTEEFDNNNGHLICLAAANAQDIPAGRYQGSCLGCTVSKSASMQTLRCTHCMAADGSQKDSEINVGQCAKFDNLNGKLSCE